MVKKDVLKTISVLVLGVLMWIWLGTQFILFIPASNPEDEDRDGIRNIGFFTLEPLAPADSPRELHYTWSPGKQQILESI
jgi:hypothetical protein